jgi:hypothetical protein
MSPPLTALSTPLACPLDIEAFNNGDLGIVHPWYRRRFLVGVYCELKWPGAKPGDLDMPPAAGARDSGGSGRSSTAMAASPHGGGAWFH